MSIILANSFCFMVGPRGRSVAFLFILGRTRPPALISAVVLAAGLSTRMGRQKLVLRVSGSPILEKVLEVLRQSVVDEVVVVLGSDASVVRREVRFRNERIVVNPNYAEGMSSSLRVGLASLSPEADAALVTLGDQPYVSPSTIDRIVEGYLKETPPVVVPVYNGVRGNPVLFARSAFPEVMKVRGDVGAKSVVRSFGERVLEILVEDEGVILDIDAPADYQRLASGPPKR